MAGAIVNPYAIAPSGPTYEEEVLADTPLGLWMLDETSGTVATDQGSVGEDGDYGSTYSPVLGTRTVFGLTAPDFQTSAVVTVPHNAAMNLDHVGASGTFTVEFLFRLDVTAGAQAFFHNGPVECWQFAAELIGNVKTSGGATVMDLSIVSFAAADTDYHFVMTYNRSTPRLEAWLNGVSIGVDTTASGSSSDDGTDTWFGAHTATAGLPMNGAICGVAFYSQVLSDARIADHYATLT